MASKTADFLGVHDRSSKKESVFYGEKSFPSSVLFVIDVKQFRVSFDESEIVDFGLLKSSLMRAYRSKNIETLRRLRDVKSLSFIKEAHVVQQRHNPHKTRKGVNDPGVLREPLKKLS